MAVQCTMASDSTATPSASSRAAAPVPAPVNSSASHRIVTGKLASASTPSRDSHDVRHIENARHAFLGFARCSVEDSSPAAHSTSAAPSTSDRCTPCPRARRRAVEHARGAQQARAAPAGRSRRRTGR